MSLNNHDIKVLITKETNTIAVNIASGNIKECADKFEHIKLNVWEYREKTDAFDDVTYRFCSSASPNKVLAKLNNDPNGGRTESPVLLIRQIDHKLPEIILNSSGILWSPNLEHKIRLRFDDEKPISTSFVNGSGTVTQIFLNSEKKLLQKLFSSKQVIFQMPNNRETFSFDLTELPEKCAGLDLSAIKK